MKKLYKDQTKSLNQIQKEIGVGKVTLYRYANKIRNVETMPAEILLKIAANLNMNAATLYEKMKEYLK